MTFLRLAIILIVIAIAGPLVWSFRLLSESDFIITNADFIVGATAFSIGVMTFFGITELNRTAEEGRLIRDENLRTAIASSLVLTYLFIVCFTTFVRNAPVIGEVTRAFMQSFAQIVSITIAFYFGATAATQIFGRRKEHEKDIKRDEDK